MTHLSQCIYGEIKQMLSGYFIQQLKKMSLEWTIAIPTTQFGRSQESPVKEYMVLVVTFTQG